MKVTDAASRPDSHPDQKKITSLQAKRLSALTGLKLADFANHTIAQLAERLKWQIDPELFLFRRICGKVVKKDAVTGELYPVPFATVYVEDTDCSHISYFPKGWPWSWHFPYFCNREVIGTAKTDACGNFCVWVPRFDIDWVLRWRHARFCYPIIFRRPEIGDLIPKLPVPVDGPWPPIPDPDPGPYRTLTTLAPSVIEAIAGRDARQVAERVARFQSSRSLGGESFPAEQLAARAFEKELPPPLPAEFHTALSGQGLVAAQGASAHDGIRSAVASNIGIDVKDLAGFDLKRFIGPFYRCYDVLLPEWQRILDVPDITFRVGQDVNGDGTEETIYSEGFFDVRWDAGAVPNVTLVANSSARETRVCHAPPVQCGNVPALFVAGFMPLNQPSYFDAGTGYMLRTNRPSADGVTPPPPTSTTAAQTPFCFTIPLHGCVDVNQAKFYRVLQSVDGGATFSAITGVSWHNYRASNGTPILITADANGWYPVEPLDASNNPVPRGALEFPNLVLDWPTPALGQVILRIETGNATKAHMAFSANVPFQVDNTAPTLQITRLAWKFAGEPDSALRNLLGAQCPTIHRHVTPSNIELVFEAQVLANHLRDAGIGSSGCGAGGHFDAVSVAVDPLTRPYHWHTSALDNTVLLHQRYTLASTADEGAYTFSCGANSRAVNPNGAHSENLVPPDWNTIVSYLSATTSIAVAVVNAN
jgi:hypothetical protein